MNTLPENLSLLETILIKMCVRDNVKFDERTIKTIILERCLKYREEKNLALTNKKIILEIIQYLKDIDDRDQYIRIKKEERIVKDRHIELKQYSEENLDIVQETPRSIIEKIN